MSDAPRAKCESALTTADVSDFHRDGYVVVRGFFGPDDMSDISAWVDDLVARPQAPGAHWVYYEDHQGRPGEKVLSRIENFCPVHERLDALLNGPRMLEALVMLLGEPAVLFKDKINFKLPGSAGFESHQDVQAGWDRYAHMHVTALVSIDAATQANGCLEMASGWHRKGLIGEAWTPLGDLVPDEAFAMCPTFPGDVVFFDSFIPHRSQPNTTSEARRVLYVTYNRCSEGDQRRRYYADKHASFPPDIERVEGREYVYRV